MFSEDLKEPWRIDVTDLEHRDRNGFHAAVVFRSLEWRVGLAGCVAAAEETGESIVVSIDRNDLFLPRRMARRLIRRIHQLYWPSVGAYGDVGIITDVDLALFMVAHFREDSTRILSLMRRTIKTFCQTEQTK